MTEFLAQYGIFLAKTVTIIVLIFLGLIILSSILNSLKQRKQEEELIVEKINDKIDDLRKTIEYEVLSKEEIKAIEKKEKKEEKQKRKEAKQKIQENQEPESRMFVVRFDGDIEASDVENLRECITAILSFANENDEVLVILESAGGMVHSYGLAASQLMRLKSRNIKLTVAVDLVAASGGYMMACVANKIIAAPFAVIGSIGVLAQLPNFNKLLEKHNVEIEHHTAGEYKTTLTMLGKNTNKERQKFQEELDETHVLFKEFVKTNREVVDIDKIATGEHWYGQQAIEKNLIDEIKTSDDFLLEASEDMDIYELYIECNESLSDKITNFMHGLTYKTLKKLLSTEQKFNKI